ncbi:uncharacterized protein LOC114935778 [Nylanderia fulva]|uniref:uncharacterized protein LOC114935778 n=1 Tax=Nylanderia fulva TaxID=613905 RepID=UPI0010FAF286|nr:uncharacterized protein LOC114935778 [Nylanderia fulva]
MTTVDISRRARGISRGILKLVKLVHRARKRERERKTEANPVSYSYNTHAKRGISNKFTAQPRVYRRYRSRETEPDDAYKQVCSRPFSRARGRRNYTRRNAGLGRLVEEGERVRLLFETRSTCLPVAFAAAHNARVAAARVENIRRISRSVTLARGIHLKQIGRPRVSFQEPNRTGCVFRGFPRENVLVNPLSKRSPNGKERRRAHDLSGCLPTLSADEEEVAEPLHPLGDRDVHPDGGHWGLPEMVSRLHGAPFALLHGSREEKENGERGEDEPREADTQTVAGVVLLRLSAALRDRSVNKGRCVK